MDGDLVLTELATVTPLGFVKDTIAQSGLDFAGREE
jgi:hypothetical protein